MTGVFCYWPMYGILLAFKNYKPGLGIFGSPWAKYLGFQYFRVLFRDPEILQVLLNTIIISFGKVIILTPIYIILALLLNELKNIYFKRTVQSILYLPHFLSWVILAGIIYNFLSNTNGVLGKITQYYNLEPVQILGNADYFRALVFISSIWKSAGWGTIIYLAAIAGINQELYEAALMDGANRLKRVFYVTLPCIKSTIIVLLILDIGHLMNAGFDQIFNLYSPTVYSTGDIIDTYVFRHGLQGLEFSYSTAVGLVKQVINVTMLILANRFAKAIGESGIY